MSGVLQKIIERTWVFLLVVGLAVLLIGASGGIQSQSVSIVIPEIGWRVLVSLVGIILFFVGLLQVLQESKLTQKTEKIRMFPVRGVALIGSSSVYNHARQLVRECKGDESILATSFGRYSDEEGETRSKEWLEYVEALAHKIGKAKADGLPMEYRVVMAFRPDERGLPPPDKMRGIQTRVSAFRANNCLDRLFLRSVDISWAIDVLIAGENMIIGFPTVGRNRELMLGIAIHNKEFVEKAKQWYSEFVWNYPGYLEWSKQQLQEITT